MIYFEVLFNPSELHFLIKHSNMPKHLFIGICIRSGASLKCVVSKQIQHLIFLVVIFKA